MNNEERHPYQKLQDDGLHSRFSGLHKEIVDRVISFCKENGIEADEFEIHADGLRESIAHGEWTSVTDSYFRIDEDLDVENGKSIYEMDKKEYDMAVINHKPLLLSI